MSRAGTTPQGEHHEVPGLKRGTLGVWAALGLAIVVFNPALSTATVGAFVAPYAGNAAWLSVLAGAVVIGCIGLAIIPFARRFVVTGALYSYLSNVFGEWAKVLSGAALAVGYVVGMMAMLGALGVYFGSWLVSIGWSHGNDLVVQAAIYAVATLAAGTLAYRGLDASTKISVGLLALCFPFVLIVLVGVVVGPGLDLGPQLSLDGFSMSGFTQGMIVSVTFLVVFETSAATALETRDPIRTVPRVIMAIPIVVGTLNVLAALITVPALGTAGAGEAMAAGASPIAAIAEDAGLGGIANVVDLALSVSIFAGIVGFYNYAPRVWATMAEDRLLPAALGRIHPSRHTPTTAIVIIGFIAATIPVLVAALTGDSPLAVYGYIATIFTYFWVIPYVLICVGAVVLLSRLRELTPVVAIAATVGALAFIWVYVNSIINPPPTPVNLMTWIAPAAIAITVVVMLITRRRQRATDPTNAPTAQPQPDAA